jgi:Acyltransferase family.
LSGYLFFYGFEWSKERYFLKLKSRIKTLLIPFLFWNICSLLIIFLAQYFPATKIYFSGNSPLIAEFSFFDFFNAIFGFNRFPISYQFWFIRDLMILVLFVPLIQIILKYRPLLFLAIVFISWFLNYWPIFAPSSNTVLFFCSGAYIATIDKSLFAGDKYGGVFVLLFIVILTLNALNINVVFHNYLHKAGIIIGIYAALFSTKFLLKTDNVKPALLWLGRSSFFVFAIHEPLLTILRKVSYKLFVPDTSALILLLYFMIPIVIIVFSVLLYRVLVGIAPNFTYIITGGR